MTGTNGNSESRETEVRGRPDRRDRLAGVAHDLRSPLHAANVSLARVREDCDSPALDDLAATHERLLELVDDLDDNLAGALTYLFGFITGAMFYVTEKENEFVRFHAAQSIATFGLVLVGAMGLVVVGTLVGVLFTAGSGGGFLVWGVLSLLLALVWLVYLAGSFGLWLYLVVRAYQGKTPRVPVAAGIADSLL